MLRYCKRHNLDNLVNLVNLDNLDNVCNLDNLDKLGNLDKFGNSGNLYNLDIHCILDNLDLSCLQVILTGCSAHRGGITMRIPEKTNHNKKKLTMVKDGNHHHHDPHGKEGNAFELLPDRRLPCIAPPRASTRKLEVAKNETADE